MFKYLNPSRYGKYTVLVLALLVIAVFFIKNYALEIGPFRNYGPNNLEISEADSEDILQEFYKLMQPLLINTVVIEPGMVFNTLKGVHQDLLMRKGFTVAERSSNFSIISLALIEKRNKTKIHMKLESSRKNVQKLFKYWTAETYLKGEDWRPLDYVNSTRLVGHHFFQRGRTLIHGVVFYERGTYYWHVGLPPLALLPVAEDALTFTKSSAYERFDPTLLRPRKNGSHQFIVPSQRTRFLMEIASSRFLECDQSRAAELKELNVQPNLRYFKLKDAFRDSLSVLKRVLYPHLKMFFIFAGTLLGWYRQCDIIPYTSDVDFAAWASDIGDEDFWKVVFGNEYIPMKLGEIMGLPEKGYELSFRINGWKVDLFFIYRNETMSWAHGHRPSKGYFFTYNYPKFELCSGDLLGDKVLVPCNAEEVILAEYGPNWMKPISRWYYESSPRNRGLRQYWTNEEKRKLAKA